MLIVDMLRRSCLKFGDKAAFRTKVAGNWAEYSYRQLWTDSDRVSRALADWGLVAGERAAILAPASPQWVAAYFGIAKAGGIIVPVDKELKRNELRHILEDCSARVLFTTEEYLETARELLAHLPAMEKIVLLAPYHAGRKRLASQVEDAVVGVIGEWRRLVLEYRISSEDVRRVQDAAEVLQNLMTPELTWKDVEDRAEARGKLGRDRRKSRDGGIESIGSFQKDGQPPEVNRHPDDPLVILYTSGTTGRSKGAMLSHANILSNISTLPPIFGLGDDIRMLSFLPINHVFEQVGGMHLPLSLGGTVSYAESLKKLGENLLEVKPNFLLGVPAVFRMLLERLQKNIQGQFLSRTLFAFPPTRPLVVRKVRETLGGTPTFVSGGAALDPEVAKGLMELGITVYQGYGITETSPVIAAERPNRRKLGTVGIPIPHVEVRIHEPNAEGAGEIWVKGPNVMLGYYNNPTATAEVLTDGWYHTGDLGRIDEDGMLVICGRLKNLVRIDNRVNLLGCAADLVPVDHRLGDIGAVQQFDLHLLRIDILAIGRNDQVL